MYKRQPVTTVLNNPSPPKNLFFKPGTDWISILQVASILSLIHIYPTSVRQFIMYEALRKGATVNELFELTKIKHYFIEQMKELVEPYSDWLPWRDSTADRSGPR